MAKIDKDILTTAETAKILGVSTRTAQLLIESGSIPSWKTPGGHRRVYRSDVMTIIDGAENPPPLQTSAMIVIIGSGERRATYRQLFAQASEFTIEVFEDVLAALVTVGSLKPYAIIVDIEQNGVDRAPLLLSLATNPSIAGSLVFAVGPQANRPADLGPRSAGVDTPQEAFAEILSSLKRTETAALSSLEEGFPIARNEAQRLAALDRSGLLDTEPEDEFDRLTWLATQMLEMPVALITLLTASRQWFKSRVGLDLTETPRSWAFCNYTILQREVFTVDDLASDPRFATNPAVASDPNFRFYAGAPILDGDGFVVGSLCVIDSVPRKLNDRGVQIIKALAAIASDELRLRSHDRQTALPPPITSPSSRRANKVQAS